MNRAMVVCRRELASYFATPVAYVFIFIFLFLGGIFTFYLGSFFERGQADLAPFFAYHPFLYLFLIPAISMRMWAEERKSGTIELLLTLPISMSAAVLGKFLAAWIFTAIALAATFPVWLTVNFLGSPDNGIIAASYLGSLLMAGAYLAIGSCISALTKNQVIAFVVSVVVCFLFILSGMPVVLGFFEGWLPAGLIDVIAKASFLSQYEPLVRGVLDARSIVYFLSLMAFWLVANALVIDARKAGQGSRAGNTSMALALGALAVLVVAVNVLAGWALRGARMDLTESELFTLTDGSRNIVAGLDEPVTLTLYVTSDLGTKAPGLKTYADRVRELIDEYVAASDGMLALRVVDPEPFSEAEDAAVSAGLQGVPISAAGDVLYMGLVATNSVGDQQTVPFFHPGKEEFLEYDLTRMFHELSQPHRPVVALMSGLPLRGQPALPMPGAPPGTPPWQIVEQIEQLFELRDVSPQDPELVIADDVDILMVVHPKDWPESALRAIDAFVMRGGKLLAFIDPHSEEDNPPADPSNPLAGMMAPRASELERLLMHWGVTVVPETVATDSASALRVTTNNNGRPEAVDYVSWLGLLPEAMNPDDQVSADLKSLFMPSVGVLQPLPGATTTFEPLVSTTAEAAMLPVARVQFMPDPKSLLQDYVPGGTPLVLAARLSGEVTSAFPPETTPASDGDETLAASDDPQATAMLNAILVADADLLADRWWMRAQDIFGMRMVMPTSDNANFVINALDNLSGSEDLISIRSRGTSQRPFERLDELRRAAELQFAAEEAELQARLNDTNNRLRTLQEQTGDGGAALLTDEVRDEIERFQAERLETRKNLREVRHQLNKDLERLVSRLKLVNVLIAPLVIVLLLAAGIYVRNRRRAAEHS